MLTDRKRRQNEIKFGVWEDLPGGGRRYKFTVQGRNGWQAVYIKDVDAFERTVRFAQEIFNQEGVLVEIHDKYPTDRGHRRIG